jgi:hypothetical protein
MTSFYDHFAGETPPIGPARSDGTRRSLVGSDCGWELGFVEKVKSDLGMKAAHREFEPLGEAYALRESGEASETASPGKMAV